MFPFLLHALEGDARHIVSNFRPQHGKGQVRKIQDVQNREVLDGGEDGDRLRCTGRLIRPVNGKKYLQELMPFYPREVSL